MRRRKNRGKVVTEVRPSRAVNPGKELCFHCSTKGSQSLEGFNQRNRADLPFKKERLWPEDEG